MRRLLATALLAFAFAIPFVAIAPSSAYAEGAQSNANTPKLALHRVELWLAVAEPKPSVADLDAGMGAAAGIEERMAMLNTEMGAVATRRRTLLLQSVAARQKIADLKLERAAAKASENGIKRSGIDSMILELTQRAEAWDTQAETLYGYMQRIGNEERDIIDAIGRVRVLADMIEESSLADARQKQKAVTLAARTTRTFRLHMVMIETMKQATRRAD